MTETTETQQKYEELFAHRFSSEDHEYQQYVNRPADPPPIVEDWRGRGGNQRGRDNRYQDRHGHRGRSWEGGGGGGGGRGWGGHRGWRGDHHGQQRWHDRDTDRDRHWGHRGGYQSGPPSSHHGYNSQYQRPHHDRY
ncbi:RNA guanine-N7 methyltransferase activating subunit-like [Parambassis ranga]|uniref:RNA guanine-N7 methyltransferase activating subunit-like n=1 Tax=Parambassis ranga TaxID=210632 RepID=A0A6P7HY62_9TELE|nr:RNA guanine-N7 methyltransferase activating subunit [Parambassis ranga]